MANMTNGNTILLFKVRINIRQTIIASEGLVCDSSEGEKRDKMSKVIKL